MVFVLIWLFGCAILVAIIHYTGTIDEAVPSDVIIVLGAGMTDDGRPNWALSRRAEHAAELWHMGYAENIICTGGVGRNVIIPRSEAEGCQEVLLGQGVPQSAIILEDTSRSTEENARNSQVIMQANGWETAILVSDSYHVFRARHIFNRAGINVLLSPVPIAKIESPVFYAYSMVREIFALHWQFIKEALNLPFTYVQFG